MLEILKITIEFVRLKLSNGKFLSALSFERKILVIFELWKIFENGKSLLFSKVLHNILMHKKLRSYVKAYVVEN